jgi:hypothetical protein
MSYQPRRLGRPGRLALAGVLIGGTVLAATDPVNLLFFIGYGAIGALLVVRRPSSTIGWLLLLIAFAFIGTTPRPGMNAQALEAGTAPAVQTLFVWSSSWAGYASYLAFFCLVVLFPSGHLPVGRWRRPIEVSLAIAVILIVLTAVAPSFTYSLDGGATSLLIPNPLAILPWLSAWSLLPADGSLALAYVIGLLASAVVAMIVRYRRSTGIIRLQLRWLVSAMAFVLVAVGFGLGSLAVFGDAVGNLAWIPALAAFPTVPLAIGVAVLRYHLYEIDRIVSRTLGYAIVTAMLALVFVGVVLGLQAVLAPLTGDNTVAVAASTLVVAALFQPLRRRTQRIVDRRFDRARYDGERTVAAFATRLRNQVDIHSLEGELGEVVRRTVAPTTLGLWIQRREAHE